MCVGPADGIWIYTIQTTTTTSSHSTYFVCNNSGSGGEKLLLLLLLLAVNICFSVMGAGQATHTDTDEAVDAWAGEITKKWTGLVAQNQKAGAPKAPAPATKPLQESAEGVVVSQDGSLSSQALDFSSPTGSGGRCIPHQSLICALSIRLCHQAFTCHQALSLLL